MGDVTTYEVRVEGRCPNDGSPDDYALIVEVRGDAFVEVERILEAVRVLTSRPIFQEVLTRRLHRRLSYAFAAPAPGDLTVTTIGWHLGVKTTCVSS